MRIEGGKRWGKEEEVVGDATGGKGEGLKGGESGG